MAYFHCLIGGGSSGGGYELTVTCDADFAGTTITCTDGVTTLTQTCPSSSPYEVVFEIPNGGDWTISGVVAGHTISTGVNIPTSAELIAIIQQTVTIHSAKEDTISYVDIDGATQTITFASGETSKQVQITIAPSGSSITFTSSVAKNPNNLSQDYSRTFTITSSTTELYLTPDAVKTLYWWGYESNELENMSTANGWSGLTFSSPTRNTHNIYAQTLGMQQLQGVGSKNAVQVNTLHGIGKATINNNFGGEIGNVESKTVPIAQTSRVLFSTTMSYITQTINATRYICADSSYNGANRSLTLYALWYE